MNKSILKNKNTGGCTEDGPVLPSMYRYCKDRVV